MSVARQPVVDDFFIIRVLTFPCWSHIAPFIPDLRSPFAWTVGPKPDCNFASPGSSPTPSFSTARAKKTSPRMHACIRSNASALHH
jgi:hypothetical protein